MKNEQDTAKDSEAQRAARLNTQRFYIVQDGDFTVQELIAIDAMTAWTLADARWALDGSALIIRFETNESYSPVMDLYPVYSNMSIQPVLAQYPWSLPF